MSSMKSSLAGRPRKEWDEGFEGRQLAAAGIAKISGDFWGIISAGYAHLFGPKRFLTATHYWRARQKAAGRDVGPDTLAEVNGADHYLSLERIRQDGELDEPIEFQLTDSFCLAPETEVPRGTHRVDLKSISMPQVFLTTEHNGLPFVKVESDCDIVVALQSPVPDAQLNLLLNPPKVFEPEPPVIRREAARPAQLDSSPALNWPVGRASKPMCRFHGIPTADWIVTSLALSPSRSR